MATINKHFAFVISSFRSLQKQYKNIFALFVLFPIAIASTVMCFILWQQFSQKTQALHQQLQEKEHSLTTISAAFEQASQSAQLLQEQIDALNNEDPRKTNIQLKKDMATLKKTYASAVTAYEQLVALRERSTKTASFDTLFAQAMAFFAKGNEASAAATLTKLTQAIQTENTKLNTTATIPANVVESSQPPSSGYRRQKITIDGTAFLVDIVAADLSSTKVIVDTASDNTCTNDCPVLSLDAYANRSGAFAGINGTYFCPETYPQCADKKNSFDVLVMNKNKVYFNSDNNVYSTVPAAIFSGNSARFVEKSLEWGRDTGVDAVIANRPLLVLDGNIKFGEGGETKETIRSNRSFVGSTGNTVYIGVVRSVTVAEGAKVLQALGIKNAINLDSGGSTALWTNGKYVAGPGRNLPNVVLFVRK